MLQTEIGRTQLNGNLFFEHTDQSREYSGIRLKYQWQVKHRWRPALQFGLQGFAELGDWDHWAPRDQQSHRAGPAIFGSLPVGNGQSITGVRSVSFGVSAMISLTCGPKPA